MASTRTRTSQNVDWSLVAGAVTFGLFSYGMLRMMNQADAENERFLAVLNTR